MNNLLPKWLAAGLGGLLLVFVALLVVDKSHTLVDAFQDKKPDNTISISAEGKVTATPDLATVNLGVITQGITAADVQSRNNEKINQITAFIKGQGINKEDITTSNFNLYPQRDYRNGQDVIVGYQANQTVSVKVRGIDKSTEQLGKIIDGAANNGANEVTGISLSFDNPDDLKEQAREQAIQKAKEKARQLADTAGLKLGKVISISETGGGYPTPVYDVATRNAAAGGLAAKTITPSIEPGSQDIIEQMTVVFEIK